MVREFNLPWQPVSKRKNREPFEIGTTQSNPQKDVSLTSNYYQCLEEKTKNIKAKEIKHYQRIKQKFQRKNSKLIDDISKSLSGARIFLARSVQCGFLQTF